MAIVFFSYCHKDEALRDQLEAHLALLKNQGLVEAWHDRRIIAGGEVDDAISSQLEGADIILLLVSSDFIASSYCYSREMKRAMERHSAGEAHVIPVVLAEFGASALDRTGCGVGASCGEYNDVVLAIAHGGLHGFASRVNAILMSFYDFDNAFRKVFVRVGEGSRMGCSLELPVKDQAYR